MDKTMVLKPRVSEKAYAMSQNGSNVYVFVVPVDVSKQAIAGAVAAQFDVTVTNVNTILSKGKAKRTVRKGGRPIAGRNSDFKKAYVTLKEGDHIAIFKSEEDEKPASSAKATTAKKEKK